MCTFNHNFTPTCIQVSANSSPILIGYLASHVESDFDKGQFRGQSHKLTYQLFAFELDFGTVDRHETISFL